MDTQQDNNRPVLMVLERSLAESKSRAHSERKLQLISASDVEADERHEAIAVDAQSAESLAVGEYVVLVPVAQTREKPDKKIGLLYRNVADRLFAELSVLLQDPQKREEIERAGLDLAADVVFGSLVAPLRMYSYAPSAAESVQAQSKEEEFPSHQMRESLSRGRQYVERQMADAAENLSLSEAANVSGMSEQAVNDARKSARLYALLEPSRQRGHRYPRWQLDVPTTRLARVLAPFKERYQDCWAIHAFMTQPNYRLDGLAPKEVIADPGVDIEKVVRAASAYISTMLGEEG
ncbi:hypothetical protein [Noviherbaspirillum pedocola]|uniref:Uncharacterized protein n=1 Tax=Noviherbaspirillum pedocola TaxID=2801341 RepID=A0A934T0G1_9BURK|nr:hypothetical protein [Noviherbaspirillum pedocola]MBK4736214.1 hypothetical protein [Noviherbaspirillum pedocola]